MKIQLIDEVAAADPKVIKLAVHATDQPNHLHIPLDQLAGYDGVKILANEIDRWIRRDKKNNTIKLLARRANLGEKTVSKIWYRETKSPRLLTCICIFKALGFVAMRLHKS